MPILLKHAKTADFQMFLDFNAKKTKLNLFPVLLTQSPDRAKSTRKSTERAKSSLVRSSVSPRRRGVRRTISPGPHERIRQGHR